MKIRILLWLLLLGFALGCVPRNPDIQKFVIRKEVSIPLYYFYYDVIWVDDDLIALAYSPEYSIIQNDKILIYDLNANNIVDIPIPENSLNCQRGWVAGNLAKMPDGNLAFNTKCISDPSGGPQILSRIDVTTGHQQQLYTYNKMSATHFSFISMDELVQENAVGHPMSNEIYKISLAAQSKTRLIPNFLRARLPSWSSNNQLIAFWGTEKFPGKEPEGLYTFQDIKRLVTYPWDLYVTDKDGNNAQKIFSSIDNAGDLSWSPKDNILAFGGTIRGTEGIWLFSVTGTGPFRVFDKSELFDWSPDGRKLVVVETKRAENESSNALPIKAYILELPDCVFKNSCE